MKLPPQTHYVPYFQPIVDVGTGQIAGHEVLTRIQNPEGSVSSAGYLFSDPDIDPSALLQLDRSVRQQAMEKYWSDRPNGFISINMAPVWLNRLPGHDASPTLYLIKALSINPANVVIEITESGSNLSMLKKSMGAYREFGLGVAIDDFGAGEAHIDRVIELEPDYVKLDIGLFKRAFRGEGLAREVVMAMSRLAERAGFDLIIEGIETEPELTFALDCGARFVQGFLFSEARMRFAEATAFQVFLGGIRGQVYKETVDLHRSRYRQEASVDKSAFILQQVIKDKGPDELLAILSPCESIIRCYITDSDGNQISDNYESVGNTFHKKSLSGPFNWSWRPYFPQIVACLLESNQKMGWSSPYKDVNTGKLVQTLGIHLTDHTLLLIDVVANEPCLSSNVKTVPAKPINVPG